MRKVVLASVLVVSTMITGHVLAQGRGGQPAVFPAQQRPPGDPVVIERGKGLYTTTCAACHGADLRGGGMGGPNLLRSQVVLSDQHGELILPIVRDVVKPTAPARNRSNVRPSCLGANGTRI